MSTQFHHPSLAAGRWQTLTLAAQLGNIGSEIHRAIKARGNKERYDFAVSRAFELFYFTIADPRWKGRRKEILRAREVFCDALLGGTEYGSTLEALDKYFYYFAYAARVNKK